MSKLPVQILKLSNGQINELNNITEQAALNDKYWSFLK